MPDEKGTDTTRSDAASADESLFGDSTDDAAVEAVEEEVSNDSVADEQADSRDAEQDSQGSGDAEAQEGADEQGAGDAGEQPAQPEGLKVVVSIKGAGPPSGCSSPRRTRTSRPSTTTTWPDWRRRSWR